MSYKFNIFSKILILLVLLLIPILLLYVFTNRTTNHVIQEQIQSSNLNQLSFFLKQLDSDAENLAMFPVILGSDPYIREFVDRSAAEPYDVLKAQSRIIEKLSLQSVSSGWSNVLTLVSPKEKQVLSSSIFVNGTTDWDWDDPIRTAWTFEPGSEGNTESSFFYREISEPMRAKTVRQASAVYQVRFTIQNIVHMLDVYKQDRKSDPFLLDPRYGSILNTTSDPLVTDSIFQMIANRPLPASGQERLVIEQQEYLVSYVKSVQLGWYLVDYVPVQQIMSPITKSRALFYVTLGLLLMMSVLAAFLLYRNVQIPIVTMIRSVQRMKRGDLSTRIHFKAKNEFDYLIQRFNEMAEQIQELVENVFAEKIRSREATLKQLQSQIHPHFLYNSLFFIINSAEMEDKESVVAMAQNLAEFYRYTTRVENQVVSLKEELELVRSYLTIQNLRISRLKFVIDVPASMMDERIPRLMIQPLVENAIIHGIERSMQGDLITITGEQEEGWNRILVQDNGGALREEDLQRLRVQLQKPMSDEIGCGTWNVHHRLLYQFSEGSGLTFERTADGSMKAILTWNRTNDSSGLIKGE